MSQFFTKISLNFESSSVNTNAEDLTQLYNFDKQQKYGVSLLKKKQFTSVPNQVYDTLTQDAEKVLSCLPSKVLELEIPKVWVLDITSTNDEKVMLAPHIDGVRKTALNIYGETNGERTCFYEYKAGGKIEEIDSFVAQKGDVYLLNVDKPHSVELVPGKNRRVLTVSFIHTSYEELVKAFQ